MAPKLAKKRTPARVVLFDETVYKYLMDGAQVRDFDTIGDVRFQSAITLTMEMLTVLEQVVDAAIVRFTPGKCLNCSTACESAKGIYCKEFCKLEAAFIRYGRRKLRARTFFQLDILRDGIGSDLALLCAGGYPEGARRVTPTMRAAIIKRDRGLCVMCGGPGNEIDHIAGNDATETNLRLLCKSCNGNRMAILKQNTDLGVQAGTRIDPDQMRRLAKRIVSPKPLRPCDEDRGWEKNWKSMLAKNLAKSIASSLPK